MHKLHIGLLMQTRIFCLGSICIRRGLLYFYVKHHKKMHKRSISILWQSLLNWLNNKAIFTCPIFKLAYIRVINRELERKIGGKRESESNLGHSPCFSWIITSKCSTHGAAGWGPHMCNISDDDAPSVIMQINFDAFITSIFLYKN